MRDEAEPSASVYAFYEAWNDRDLDRCAALLHPRCTIEDLAHGAIIAGREAGRSWLHDRALAYPDGVVEVVQLVTEGRWVVAETLLRATARTEKRSCEVDQVEQGLIVTSHIY